MSANDYWAKAQSGSPGTNLAEMQARLYAGETTQRMMEKIIQYSVGHRSATWLVRKDMPTNLVPTSAKRVVCSRALRRGRPQPARGALAPRG